MNGVNELYREFRQGLETTPGPEDPTLFELWTLWTEVTDLVRVRLTEPRMGGNFSAARRVEMCLCWSEQTGRISKEMPLRVPSPTLRAVKAAGRFLERTWQIEELGEFLRLGSPIVNDLSEYAAANLGRQAKPVIDEFSFVSRMNTLTYEAVARSVPGLGVAA